jgi:hypothetical protein
VLDEVSIGQTASPLPDLVGFADAPLVPQQSLAPLVETQPERTTEE